MNPFATASGKPTFLDSLVINGWIPVLAILSTTAFFHGSKIIPESLPTFLKIITLILFISGIVWGLFLIGKKYEKRTKGIKKEYNEVRAAFTILTAIMLFPWVSPWLLLSYKVEGKIGFLEYTLLFFTFYIPLTSILFSLTIRLTHKF